MESVRQPIVDMLYEVLNGKPPVFVDGTTNQAKARLAYQLIKSGYLDGAPTLDGQGQVLQVAILDVTIEGRQYCDQLEQKFKNSRLGVKTGKTVKKGLLILMGAIGGVVLTVVTQWILARLNFK